MSSEHGAGEKSDESDSDSAGAPHPPSPPTVDESPLQKSMDRNKRCKCCDKFFFFFSFSSSNSKFVAQLIAPLRGANLECCPLIESRAVAAKANEKPKRRLKPVGAVFQCTGWAGAVQLARHPLSFRELSA